jgi:hypothetical protein
MPFVPSMPFINGNRYSFSEVKFKIFGKLYVGIHAIDYAPECAPGLFEANWLATCSIGDALNPQMVAQVDTIIGCRFSRFTVGWRQGPDALTVKLDFTFMNMLVNGVPLLNAATIPIR